MEIISMNRSNQMLLPLCVMTFCLFECVLCECVVVVFFLVCSVAFCCSPATTNRFGHKI